jgi:ABC-type Fe3+-siderophore transport system permease subunit
MANITNLPHVLVLDTAADNIVASTVGVRVRKVRIVAAAAAVAATLTDAGGTVGKIGLIAAIGATDTAEFFAAPLVLNGLQLLALSGAGALVYVYTEQA